MGCKRLWNEEYGFLSLRSDINGDGVMGALSVMTQNEHRIYEGSLSEREQANSPRRISWKGQRLKVFETRRGRS